MGFSINKDFLVDFSSQLIKKTGELFCLYMEKQEKVKQVKRLRFQMDQITIDELKLDKEQLKEALKNTIKKKDELYKVSLEYKKLCEEEIGKNQLLLKKISALEGQFSNELRLKDLMIQELQNDLDRRNNKKSIKTVGESQSLSMVFTSFLGKIQKNTSLKRIFRDKAGNYEFSLLSTQNIEDVFGKILLFTEELFQYLNIPSHRKNLSYDATSINPLFSSNSVKNPLKSPKIAIKKPPSSLSKISEDLEIAVNSSKNILRTCIDTLESGSITSRSNFSSPIHSMKPKVRIYRRPKSMSQLV